MRVALGHFGVTLGLLEVYGGDFRVTFGPYRCHMAGRMRIGAGLVGLKSADVHATQATS